MFLPPHYVQDTSEIAAEKMSYLLPSFFLSISLSHISRPIFFILRCNLPKSNKKSLTTGCRSAKTAPTAGEQKVILVIRAFLFGSCYQKTGEAAAAAAAGEEEEEVKRRIHMVKVALKSKQE